VKKESISKRVNKHRVFHCVRGHDIGIVAVGESGKDPGDERDGNVPFRQVVRLTRSLASP